MSPASSGICSSGTGCGGGGLVLDRPPPGLAGREGGVVGVAPGLGGLRGGGGESRKGDEIVKI